MQPSEFLVYIQGFLARLAVNLLIALNDPAKALRYRFRTMLKEEYSDTGQWSSISSVNTYVMADVVAMDSPYSLKSGASMGESKGDIIKIGVRYQFNESQLDALDRLIRSGNRSKAQIATKILANAEAGTYGVYERLEFMFLQALSTGETVVQDVDNVGQGVRFNYGYRNENMFGVSKLFSDPTARPFDDIGRVLAKAEAKNDVIVTVKTDRATLDNICKTAQAKELYAFSIGYLGGNVPTPDIDQLNKAVNSRYGWSFEIIERTMYAQKNGTNTAIKPWAAGSMIFLTTLEEVGSLVYTDLVEMNRPVAGVEYQMVGEYIQTSLFRKVEPSISEHTRVHARALPVIADVEHIYRLDTTQLQA